MPEELKGEEQEAQPLRARTFEEFCQIETQVFETPEDQGQAERIYFEKEAGYRQGGGEIEEKVKAGAKVILKPGSMVYRRGTFQLIKYPYEVEAGIFGKNGITIPLPDGANMYINDVDILELPGLDESRPA